MPYLSEDIKNAFLNVAIDRAKITILERLIDHYLVDLINTPHLYNVEYIRYLNFERWYLQQLSIYLELGLNYANQLAIDSGLTDDEMARVQNYAIPHDYIFEAVYLDSDLEDMLPFRASDEDTLNCDIDFTRVPIVELDVDLSNKWDILTKNTFVPGNDYYCVSIMLTPELARGRPLHSIEYFSIGELQEYLKFTRNWLDFKGKCKHPMYDTSISLENITRFTYRGAHHGIAQGGKPIHKRSYINKKKTKKSIKKRLIK
jgi:hypothetical protein